MGRLTSSIGLAAVIAAGLLLASVGVVAAATPTFGTPTATASFGTRVVFTQPIHADEAIGSAELLLTFPGEAGPEVIEVPAPYGTGDRLLSYTFDLSVDGHIAPNTRLSARWRVHPTATPDAPITGPLVAVTYADTRFDWKTASGNVVRVHWYEGDAAFGAHALQIGEDAVESASTLLGVSETDPIDFYVYADKAAFYDALGPGTRENVGGQANSEIRTMFALVTPDEIDQPWVDIVVPHELTHLVFDTATDNPYHFPPRWLNEGLAEYQSQGYDAGYRATIADGARAGTLIPLDGLTGQFPTTYERFSLAYAESTAAVDFLVRTYGKDALVTLINSYASGLTDDEAFTQALGLDATAFGDAWLKSVGAVAPVRFGPQPAAPGPVPAPWAGQPAPGSSAAPGSTSGPASPTAIPTTRPGSDAVGTASSPGGIALLVGVGVITLVSALGLYRVRRRQDAADACPCWRGSGRSQAGRSPSASRCWVSGS